MGIEWKRDDKGGGKERIKEKRYLIRIRVFINKKFKKLSKPYAEKVLFLLKNIYFAL